MITDIFFFLKEGKTHEKNLITPRTSRFSLYACIYDFHIVICCRNQIFQSRWVGRLEQFFVFIFLKIPVIHAVNQFKSYRAFNAFCRASHVIEDIYLKLLWWRRLSSGLCFRLQDAGQEVTGIWRTAERDYCLQKWQSTGVMLGNPQGSLERVYRGHIQVVVGVSLAYWVPSRKKYWIRA